MISIKKFLEHDSDRRLASIEAAYRSALTAMGESAMAGHAETSHELHKALSDLRSSLPENPDVETIKKTEAEVGRVLDRWGLQTALHLQQTAEEVKSLLVAIAGTAHAVGERDQACTNKLNELTGRLDTIARLDDMSRMRNSIIESATELKVCVREMVENSAQTATQFQSQIETYKGKLEETEQRTRRDGLTNLYNRYGLERTLNRRIEERRAFSLVMVDLDNFKAINDQYGHLAGDELLKLFAEELKYAVRTSDVLGRWGGDEFVLILDSTAEAAAGLVERMRRMVTGDYKITVGGTKTKISVHASFGIADYKPGDAVAEIMARADQAMYAHKGDRKRQSNGTSECIVMEPLAAVRAGR